MIEINRREFAAAQTSAPADDVRPRPITGGLNMNRRWKAAEDDLAIDLFCLNGVSLGGISTRLSRSRESIRARLIDLGVRGVSSC